MTQVNNSNQWQFNNVRFPEVFLAFDGSDHVIASQTPSNWAKFPSDGGYNKYVTKSSFRSQPSIYFIHFRFCDSNMRYACGSAQGRPILLSSSSFVTGAVWQIQRIYCIHAKISNSGLLIPPFFSSHKLVLRAFLRGADTSRCLQYSMRIPEFE
jgi:hypothetical protein